MSAVPIQPSRSTTVEIDGLRSELSTLAMHLRQVSDELAAERSARAEEREKGISVLRLHVPFLLWFATVGGLVGFGVAGGMFVKATQGHISNTRIHLDEQAALAKGGPVYQAEARAELASAVSDLEAGDRRIGRVLRGPINCHSNGPKLPTVCEFPDPALLPLRP